MKTVIQKRWHVEGIYRYDERTSSWVFAHTYRPGEVVWEFDRLTVTCLVDGFADFTAPWTFMQGDILVIAFTGVFPYSNRGFESYKVIERGGEVSLFDRKTKTRQGFRLAIKLVPTE